MPPDLITALHSTEATQMLWDHEMSYRTEYPLVRESEDWWSVGMPSLVNALIVKLRHANAEQVNFNSLSKQVASQARIIAGQSVRIEHAVEDADAKAEAAEAEIERLKGELREAKGREEALRDALALLGPGGQAMAAAGAQ